MMRSFLTLTHVDLGFSPERSVQARIVPAVDDRYDTPVKKKLFFEQILKRVKAVPGVINATVSISVPPLGGAGSYITIPGKTHSERWESMVDLCSEGYFQTLGLQLLRGRLLSETDIDSARHVAVVNRAFGRTYLWSEDPLGQKLKYDVLEAFPESRRD